MSVRRCMRETETQTGTEAELLQIRGYVKNGGKQQGKRR